MSDVTLILNRLQLGDARASEQLLPLVYEELRRLAQRQMTQEAAGHTLQATALVHEAYVRLVSPTANNPAVGEHAWDSRGHFYMAAAEAMRRILIEIARKKKRRGGSHQRLETEPLAQQARVPAHDLLALDDALEQLELEDPQKAQLVKLRFFGGCSIEEAAEFLGISRSTADRHWAYSRAWLLELLNSEKKQPPT